MSNYLQYRGKCKELSEALVKSNPKLRLVRGFYHCPIWNTKEQHWWCVDLNGTIYDPSAKQFPSAGAGDYEEFLGFANCSVCGRECTESELRVHSFGKYIICSYECYGKMVM